MLNKDCSVPIISLVFFFLKQNSPKQPMRFCLGNSSFCKTDGPWSLTHIQYCIIGQRELASSSLALMVQLQCPQHFLTPSSSTNVVNINMIPFDFSKAFQASPLQACLLAFCVSFFKEHFFLLLCTKY